MGGRQTGRVVSVDDGGGGREEYARGAANTYPTFWQELAPDDFRYDEKGNEPAPSKQAECQVVPKRHEREDEEAVKQHSLGTAEGDVDVSAHIVKFTFYEF